MHCLGELADVIHVHTRPRVNHPCQAALDSNNNRAAVTQLIESNGQQLLKKPAACISGSGVSSGLRYRRPQGACAPRQIVTERKTITKSDPTTGRRSRSLPQGAVGRYGGARKYR
jgi:hypothetical protein